MQRPSPHCAARTTGGGWGLACGFSKAPLHRIAGILDLEVSGRGVRAFNVQPGFVATERMAQDMGAFGFDASGGAPPDVVGAGPASARGTEPIAVRTASAQLAQVFGPHNLEQLHLANLGSSPRNMPKQCLDLRAKWAQSRSEGAARVR